MTRWRYRRGQTIVVAALAALVTACTVFAPLYDRAMRQAVTDVVLDRVPVEVAGVTMNARAEWFGPKVPPPRPEYVLEVLGGDLGDSFGEPVLGYTARASVAPGRTRDPTGDITWRDGQCDHLDFVDGSCPGDGEVAVSEADVRNLHVTMGSRVGVSATPVGGLRPRTPTVRLEVAGVYRQREGDYWFGLDLTGRSGIVATDRSPRVQHDVWLTDRGTFEARTPLDQDAATVMLPLARDRVGVDDVLRLGPDIATLIRRAPSLSTGSIATANSGLPDLGEDVRIQVDQSRVTVPLLMAQLGLLAVVVLWLVLLAVTEQRRPEVALARLRGRGRRGARGLLLGELLPITLSAVVPGALLAVLGAWAARTFVLPTSPPFELGWRFVEALALAVAVLAVITVTSVARVAREPVATLLRRVPPRRVGWTLGVLDALLIAGAGAVVVLFVTGGLNGPVALAAPGLLAIFVGLVLAHLTTPTAAIVGRRLLARGRVRAGVAVLDAARSPATRRTVAIVTLAAALAVFSADALVVGQRNRTYAAEQEAGADVVADVPGTDLNGIRAALAEVDPDGRRVTPVVSMRPAGTGGIDSVAVVPDQFRRIALFPGGSHVPDSVWDRLRVPDAKPIKLSGTRFGVDLSDSTLRSVRVDGKSTPLTLSLQMIDLQGRPLQVTLGELRRPFAHRHLERVLHCSDGCYLIGIDVSTLPGARTRGSVTLSDLETDAGAITVGPADRWTPNHDPENGSITPTSDRPDRPDRPDRLTVRVASRGAAGLTMAQAWLPGTVPALVAGRLPEGSNGDGFGATGLDGGVRDALRVGALPRVPAAPRNTAVLNLDAVSRGSSMTPEALVSLWFVDDDPALVKKVSDALTGHGLTLEDPRTLTSVRGAYDDSTAAWSLWLAAVVGAAAILMALLVLVVNAAGGWRTRTRDLAALRMSGISTRAVRRISVLAQLPAVVIGGLAGTLCGVVGAQLALPTVPLFADTPPVSTLDLDTDWTAVVVTAAVAVVVLGSAGVGIGRAIVRRARLTRLREAS